MEQVQLATKIDGRVKKALVSVCESRGLKINRFLEEAILDKLEELEDREDLARLRRERFRPFRDVLAELKAHGRL